ncbi:hypothetical protein AAFN88_12645 [Pelagibius sp. CAU 1746]|uniref:hypothetical protein n=1 Tax=Pelagibius sp. CAU 1746 TaxID=3140370 RepID=UPI00325A7E38
MSLSRSSVETLIDLVEIKLSCVEVYDRDDSRELINLKRCKEELMDLVGMGQKVPAELLAMPKGRRRGRRPSA